jgi:gluconolactonase
MEPKFVLTAPEGPIRLDEENLLVVEMGNVGTISKVNLLSGKVDRLIHTGRPNGLALDSRGNVWVAESEKPSILRYTLYGKMETVLTGSGSADFLFPNDFALDETQGFLYMTDSGMLAADFCPNERIREDYAAVHYEGKVFCINIETFEVMKIDENLQFPNGIALGPDGKLYVNETMTGNVYCYETDGQGNWGKRQYFSNVIHQDGLHYYRGPDGMKFSVSGKLYCTVYGQGDVVVIDLSGKIERSLPTRGKCPTNLIFVDTKIYVTEVQNGTLDIIDAGERGLV